MTDSRRGEHRQADERREERGHGREPDDARAAGGAEFAELVAPRPGVDHHRGDQHAGRRMGGAREAEHGAHRQELALLLRADHEPEEDREREVVERVRLGERRRVPERVASRGRHRGGDRRSVARPVRPQPPEEAAGPFGEERGGAGRAEGGEQVDREGEAGERRDDAASRPSRGRGRGRTRARRGRPGRGSRRGRSPSPARRPSTRRWSATAPGRRRRGSQGRPSDDAGRELHP